MLGTKGLCPELLMIKTVEIKPSGNLSIQRAKEQKMRSKPGKTGFFVSEILARIARKLSGIFFMIGSDCRWFEHRKNKKRLGGKS